MDIAAIINMFYAHGGGQRQEGDERCKGEGSEEARDSGGIKIMVLLNEKWA